MKRFKCILLWTILFMAAFSCSREELDYPDGKSAPEGSPVTIYIPFGADDLPDVSVGTKAEASRSDDSRVHDLYVMIFDSEGTRFYGRYFTYNFQSATLEDLLSTANEGWYVDNVGIKDPAEKKTKGVVKIATQSRSNCTMVVIANVANTVTTLDGQRAVTRLDAIKTLAQLKEVKVKLQQDIVDREDLFLMLGQLTSLDTGSMSWRSPVAGDYTGTKVPLVRLDAKVKFRVSYNSAKIESIDPHLWQVCNVPSSGYLYPRETDPGERFFDTEPAYFEPEEVDSAGDIRWQVFTFYMLENRPVKETGKPEATEYAHREKQVKLKREDTSDGVLYDNGDWQYAPSKASYVKFNMVLTLKKEGISQITGSDDGFAMTTDARFTVHLGNFTSSVAGEGHDYDNFQVERNHAYTYSIIIDNSKNVYIEVTDEDRDKEPSPGHEGSLLFTSDAIVICDAHYESHSMTFRYDASLDRSKVSWNVKTPFWEGGAKWNAETGNWDIGVDDSEAETADYEWVLFAVNEKDGSEYSKNKRPYPGNQYYDRYWKPREDPDNQLTWTPEGEVAGPRLMNINQLVDFIFYQSSLKPLGTSVFLGVPAVINVTAFIDEFYYETDPRTGAVNPDLWREFVNVDPRELHILSDAQVSADGQSRIVNSTHSLIQRSMQSVYNISSPFLTSIWGSEHIDEMKRFGLNQNVLTGWPWDNVDTPTLSGRNNTYFRDTENGRYNTAGIWGVNPEPATLPSWGTYLNYNVDNVTPELRTGEEPGGDGIRYRYMAYSCMTRNRDNNGNGYIDPDEIRWYQASINQLTALWVGNEALSLTSRIYQPIDANSFDPVMWRSHVVSSTCSNGTQDPRTLVAEEGISIYNYQTGRWASGDTRAFTGDGDKSDETWNKVQSVRCVRNAGTFQDGGKTRDVSYAPLDYKVDLYFETPVGIDANNRLLPNADGTYTITFQNLNTKSIRKYTGGDLPYHNEYSEQNKVYLKLDMQNPVNRTYKDGTLSDSMHAINETILKEGYNKYCPAGYRLPNMTELSLMAALLPDEYWPPAGHNCPSRTYFSKGEVVYESSSPYPTELSKTGWAYSSRQNMRLTEKTREAQSIRCVKDDNMTGDISGKLMLSNSRVHAGDKIDLNFNFTSTASAFSSVQVQLCYLNSEGDEVVADDVRTSEVHLNGVALRETLADYTIPADLPVRGAAYFRTTLRNAAGLTEEFITPLNVISEVYSTLRLLPVLYNANTEYPNFPVLIYAGTEDGVENVRICSARLTVTGPDSSETFNLTPPSGSERFWQTTHPYWNDGNIKNGTYTFQLEVMSTVGGAAVTTRAERTVSMEILRRNENDNPDNSSYKKAGDFNRTWGPVAITNLNFAGNDFIEVDMDLKDCDYRPASDGPQDKDTNLWMDNILSLGPTSNLGWVDNVFHMYYPAHESEGEYLQIQPKSEGGVKYIIQDRLKPLHFRMEQEGIYINGEQVNENLWTTRLSTVKNLLRQSTVYIGSVEGRHRSRATYRFVRVVYNGAAGTEEDEWRGSFEGDPVNGGSL